MEVHAMKEQERINTCPRGASGLQGWGASSRAISGQF
jgi:hypothetical protein